MTEETLFAAALEKRTPAERAAFLVEACAGDPALRQRVEALLRSHDDAEFLRRPAVEQAAHLDESCATEPELRRRVEQLLGGHPTLAGSTQGDGPDPAATIEASPAREGAGTTIGPYTLIQPIGEGGMGTVFLAEQTHPVRRKVALKLIKAGMDTRQVIARFEAERQALALMDHPNIARVLDAGTTGAGRPYFVMELVKGVPITRFCDERHLTPRQRLELFIPVCHAVQHAHQKGIIHRDLKPSNVLVTLYDGVPVPRVIDFGVAKATGSRLTERTLHTEFGSVVGTLEYMSPEQAELNQLDIDTRSDIYSLGVLLYELLTGTTPLPRERLERSALLEVLRVIREDEPPRPSTRLSTTEELPSIAARRGVEPRRLSGMIRGELDWIVMKALEKDRRRRYETANGLATDLQHYLADEPVQACPPSAAYRFRKFARRHRVALATAVAVGLAVLLAVVVLAVSNVRIRRETRAKETALIEKGKALAKASANYEEARSQEKRAEQHARTAEEQRGIARANEKRARDQTLLANRRLYASQMNLAMQSARSGEWPRVLELLEGQRPSKSGEDLRGFEWFYLWRLCNGGRRVPIRGHDRSVLGLAFSPDGRTLASAGWDGAVRLWDTATGAERMALRGHRRPPWSVAYSPDGRLLASGGKETGSLIIWDARTGKPLQTIPHSVIGLAFSPDSKRLAAGVVAGGTVDATLWDVATGAESARIGSAGAVVGFPGNGESLVTFTNQFAAASEVQCWELDRARLRYRFAAPHLLEAALSPDCARIVGSASMGAFVLESATGKQVTVAPGLSQFRGLALSHDNALVACGTSEKRVVVVSLETGRPVVEDFHLDQCWTVAFSPDRKMVATASVGGAVHLRDLAPSDEPTTFAADGVRALAFSADGRRLFVGHFGRTKIIDVGEGKEIAQLPQTDVASFSAGLRRLARSAGDGKLTAWETDSGRQVAELSLPIVHPATGLALSPDGTLAATHYAWRSYTAVDLWDLAAGRRRTLKPDRDSYSALCAGFSPDGSLLAAGFQFYIVTVWDVASGRVKCEFAMGPGLTSVVSVAFASDSRALAAGTDVGYVKLWDTRTGTPGVTIKGHARGVRALAFAPDGNTLATGSDDRTIKLWDTSTGQERCTLAGHNGAIRTLRFSPDGTALASASDDGTLRLWRAPADRAALARRPDPKAGAPISMDALHAHQAALALVRGDAADRGDPIQAIALANKAIALRPLESGYWLTLAIAHYRAGHWREAVAALDESEKLTEERSEQYALVRAMLLWKLDRKGEARALYEAAARQVDRRLSHDEEIDRFRAEAAEMFGLPVPGTGDALPPVAIDVSKQVEERRRTLARLDAQPDPPPDDRWGRCRVAQEYLRLAKSSRDAGDLATAEAASRSSYARFVQLVREDGPACRFAYEAGHAAALLCELLLRSGRKAEALPVASRASSCFRAAARARPHRDYYQDAAAIADRRLGQLLRDLDDIAAAEQAERDALAETRKAEELRAPPRFDELLAGARPHIEQRDWKRAAEALAKASDPRYVAEPESGYRVALVRLLAGDVDGYATLAEGTPKQFLSHEYHDEIARILTLHPRGAGDPAALVAVAQDADRAASEPRGCWPSMNLGMAHYRAGRFEQALAHIAQAQGFGEWRIYWPALAMTHHRLGHADEARRWLHKANAHLREVTDGGPESLKAAMAPFWEDWAYFEVLLREANALIEGDPHP